MYRWSIGLERVFVLPFDPRWVRHTYLSKEATTIPYTCGLSLGHLESESESLERIIETKMYDLDVKVAEIQTIVEKLRDDVEDNDARTTTD